MPCSVRARTDYSLTFMTYYLQILQGDWNIGYSACTNGMTVLRPSLPPVSWAMTRMVSWAPGAPARPAARAVRPRKVGTLRPQATRPEVFRKSRRVGDMIRSSGLATLRRSVQALTLLRSVAN